MTTPWAAELARLSATLASAEAYAAALATGQLPAALIRLTTEALACRLSDPARLEQITAILVQVVDMGATGRDEMAKAAASWAMDTLLSLRHAMESPEDDTLQESPALQKLQALTFTTTSLPATASGDVVSWLLPWLDEDDEKSALEPEAASEVLELCATMLERDDEFLTTTEALLTKTDCVTLGKAFLKRMLHTPEQTSAAPPSDRSILFGRLSLQSKVRVWGSHIPTWRRQLQQWLLAAHRQPFRSISSVLAFQPPLKLKTRPSKSGSDQDSATDFQQYSHLYVTFMDWCHEHASLLGSCRSIELVGTLAALTRPTQSTGVFNRSIADADCSAASAFWTNRQQIQRFIQLREAIKRLETECARLPSTDASSKALVEWVGVAERQHLMLEAMEMLFQSEDQSSLQGEGSTASSGAALVLGWFYSHITTTGDATPAIDQVKSVVENVRRNLNASDLEDGARWLQSNRAGFADLPALRLRLVWFWLLKCIHNSLPVDRHLVTGGLETIEYAFRRFAPTGRKRAFQVDVAAQFVVDLEWRSNVYRSLDSLKTRAMMAEYETNLQVVTEWLTKIVRLLPVEELQTRPEAANDVLHLTERLCRLYSIEE